LILRADEELVRELSASLLTRPEAAAELARQRLSEGEERPAELRAELHRVLAWAALEVGDGTDGLRHARVAVRHAVAASSVPLEGRCRTALVRALAFSNRTTEAAREVRRAVPMVAGADLGDLHLQHMVVLYKQGNHRAAMTALDEALSLMDDEIGRARALNNRGVLRLYVGGFAAGLNDLLESERVLRACGLTYNAAMARTNVAMMRDRLGDPAGALKEFDAAISELVTLGVSVDRYYVYRAEVLLSVFLVDEIADGLPAAIEGLEAAGMLADAGEGRLYLAQALVLAGDDAAAHNAHLAHIVLSKARRWGWAALARHAEVQARTAAGEFTPALLELARRSSAALRRAGLLVAWRESLLAIGEVAAAVGREGEALRAWETAAALASGPLLVERVIAAEASARLHLAAGHERSALRAADRGLRLVETQVATMAATDVRASAVVRGTRLAAIGIGIAWTRGDARLLFRWAERWRAASLWLGPVRPPERPELVEMLAELRQAARVLRDAQPDAKQVALDRQRVAALERAVRDAARDTHDSTTGRASSAPPRPTLRVIAAALECRMLVQLVERNGALAAVVVDRHSCTLVELGALAPVLASAQALLFGTRRLIRLPPSRTEHGRATTATIEHLTYLQGLLQPIRHLVGDRELVLVPINELHATPWTGVFGDASAVTVAPSASSWLRAYLLPNSGDHVVVAAGPDLHGATEEARRVGRVHPRSIVLLEEQATVAAVASAVEGASIAHLAAHATIRRDNPLFSSLHLVDGAVTAYDFEQVRDPPRLLVLAACSSAIGRARFGSDVVGLAVTLLGAGTKSIIASVAPLADVATVNVMERLHGRLANGDSPARALRLATSGDDPESLLARLTLVCLGAG
jgi:CHAT domain